MIRKISRIPVREAFKHEALDFTCWFEESIGLLNDLLDAAIGQCRVNVK